MLSERTIMAPILMLLFERHLRYARDGIAIHRPTSLFACPTPNHYYRHADNRPRLQPSIARASAGVDVMSSRSRFPSFCFRLFICRPDCQLYVPPLSIVAV